MIGTNIHAVAANEDIKLPEEVLFSFAILCDLNIRFERLHRAALPERRYTRLSDRLPNFIRDTL
jgi:hypothetical protein